ncbi:MAG TPA: hypothetical protein VFH73_24900 [Polyangia bacterium]|jgi:hypothetical protein|nr:hypothetical protein [Polyangia bacterium]
MTTALQKTCLAVMLLSSLLWVFGCGVVTPAKSDAGGDSGGGSGGTAGGGSGGTVTGSGGAGGSGGNGGGGSVGSGGVVGSGGSGGARDAGSGGTGGARDAGSGGSGGGAVDAARDVAMGGCTTDNDCVFRPGAACCGMCMARLDMQPPQDIVCPAVLCAQPPAACVCINGHCGGGMLQENAVCMPQHDLCGSGLRCCQFCSPLPGGGPCQPTCTRPVTINGNGAPSCPPPPP